MMRWLKSLASRAKLAAGRPSVSWRAEKPWKRGTFTRDMQPLQGASSWSCESTFCRHCGDWIVDTAYDFEHSGKHRPRRGSWNWLHPEAARRNPGDLKSNHEEWLAEIRDYADRCTADGCVSFGGSGPAIDPNLERAFHSEEEARETLEPFGCRVYWSDCSGWIQNGVASGAWAMEGRRDARLEYEQRRAG